MPVNKLKIFCGRYGFEYPSLLPVTQAEIVQPGQLKPGKLARALRQFKRTQAYLRMKLLW